MLNYFDTEWKWGKSTIIMVDNASMLNLQFTNGYHYAFLEDLKVHPEYRKKGLATTLMNKAEELVKENGFNEIHLKVEKEQDFLIKWYERLGYEIIIEDEYYWMRKFITK